MESTLLCETDVLGTAYTSVGPEYSGPCALVCRSGKGTLTPRAVFPSVTDANSAASFAVGALGGYARADVYEAPAEPPTHDSWVDWAF
jgi:hypothetical protein